MANFEVQDIFNFSSCSESVSRKSSVESVASNDAVMAEETSSAPSSPPFPLITSTAQDKTSSSPAAAGIAKKAAGQQPTTITNNNSLPKEVSMEELELLKKLEEQNR